MYSRPSKNLRKRSKRVSFSAMPLLQDAAQLLLDEYTPLVLDACVLDGLTLGTYLHTRIPQLIEQPGPAVEPIGTFSSQNAGSICRHIVRATSPAVPFLDHPEIPISPMNRFK